jgi:hypothetical protein
MESFSLENLESDGIERQVILDPDTPEQPLISIQKKKERAYFEAEFALELAGVTKTKIKFEPVGKQDEKTKVDAVKFRQSLVRVPFSGQGLRFVYSGGNDEHGNPSLDWRIIGVSKGLSVEDAALSARQLFQNLNVILKALRNDYFFVPIIAPERFGELESGNVWIGKIKPLGIEIKAPNPSPLGFITENNSQKAQRSVIIVPYDDKGAAEKFDAVTAGIFGCPSDVRVIISVANFMLSKNELQHVATALKWLKNGEVKQVRYDSVEERIDDDELLKKIKKNLELWMKNPSGYRITCKVLSNDPIPESYLSIISRDLFNSPVSIDVRKADTQSEDKPSTVDSLDLTDCINSAATMPILFPDKTGLLNCGVRRVFSLPKVNLKSNGILLGHVPIHSLPGKVYFSRTDRTRHVYICGATGTGKSTLLYNMLRQDIENDEGIILIDPHGDLYSQILNSIPSRRINDVVLIDPSDFEFAVGVNFLECSGFYRPVQINFIVNEMIKIFDRLYDLRQTGGPIFEQYMRNALLLAMDNEFPGATLMDIPPIFEDKGYRRFLLDRCRSEIVKAFWTKQAERAGGEAALENIAPYITSKLNQFTNNALLRVIIGQPRTTVDFRAAMDKGKIVLVNLSKGYLGELDTQLLGMLIIGKVFSSAMGRVTLMPERRRPVFLYIDEFQNFVTDSVAHLLSEARKFGLHLALANQNLTQLKVHSGRQDVLDSVLGNVGSIIMLRLGAVDAEKMTVYTKPELDEQDLQDLPDFYAVARLLSNNTPSRPFVFETLPMKSVSESSLAKQIVELSRRKHSVPVGEIEKAIIQRRTKYEDMAKESHSLAAKT